MTRNKFCDENKEGEDENTKEEVGKITKEEEEDYTEEEDKVFTNVKQSTIDWMMKSDLRKRKDSVSSCSSGKSIAESLRDAMLSFNLKEEVEELDKEEKPSLASSLRLSLCVEDDMSQWLAVEDDLYDEAESEASIVTLTDDFEEIAVEDEEEDEMNKWIWPSCN